MLCRVPHASLARAPSISMLSEAQVTTAVAADVVGKVVPTGVVQSWYDSGLRLATEATEKMPPAPEISKAPTAAPTRSVAWNPQALDVSKLPTRLEEQFVPAYLQTCVPRVRRAENPVFKALTRD